MLMLPSPEPLDDRPAEGVVLAVERGHVPLSRVDGQTFVRLYQRCVADHVGEHDRDQPAIEPSLTAVTITLFARTRGS